MKVYVSGPMSGYDEFNFPEFHRATVALTEAGYDPVSPHLNGLPVGSSWEDHLRADLRMLLDCKAVATLDGWEASRGATLECHVADALGMRVSPLNDYAPVSVAPGADQETT